MDSDFLTKTVLPHLGGQFERALPILFTGAGFSAGALNVTGDAVPLGMELKKKLWTLCFPDAAFDSSTSLQSLFEHAAARHKRSTTELLTPLLTVDPSAIPEWYATVFRMPWARCYTLNIDDLANAVASRFELPLGLEIISATSEQSSVTGRVSGPRLEIVHLNGTVADLPDQVTFSTTQYAQRLARPEPWYVRLAADLLSQACVFIGTQLDESPFWQHLELRKMRGNWGARELRPRSYLVTRTLDLPRQTLLADFNIVWLPMTGEEFTNQILSVLRPHAVRGLAELSRLQEGGEVKELQEVATLSRNPTERSEFLLGNEPIWADLQSERAILRSTDDQLWRCAQARLTETEKGFILLTGTAGSGKSTSLMRLCLRLVAEGVRVGWVNRETDLLLRDIRRNMRESSRPDVLALDDADMYGSELAVLVRELVRNGRSPLILGAIRAGKVDRVLPSALLAEVPAFEFAMPPLEDREIDSLIDLLDRENRLGILKGKNRNEQQAAFREQAGRQLLVAMIQATSGKRFEDKCVQELTDLPECGVRGYALIAVATSFRYGLAKNEILLATGDHSNEMLNSIEHLLGRHIATERGNGAIWARHRTIADIIRQRLEVTGQLVSVISGLAFLAATKVRPQMARSDRSYRLLRAVLSHDMLIRSIGVEAARNMYGSLEDLLHWDFHYWLQRGSLEVEQGDLSLAEHFLNQSRALNPNDSFVNNEWAYFLFSKALRNPTSDQSPEMVNEAIEILEELIEHDRVDSYPYHVFGESGAGVGTAGTQ